jgi:spermidine/putrescine transport system ATP-binding protein
MLELIGIGKSFKTTHAVQDVDLQIPNGEFFSLLGPSGCGKTTLLRMLAGFESPTRGEIRHDGARIDTLPANRRAYHLVFQRYALFPHLSVQANVAFGLKMKRVPRAEIERRVEEILALVKMQGMGPRGIETLSGGQQQRIALARALVNQPRVLLLDEPLSALDLKLRQQMQVELRAIQKRLGHTFIFVTHDQEEALTLSDRIAVMNNGRIEQVGTPREIYEHPRTAFVARFIGSINAWEGKIEEVDGAYARVAVQGAGLFKACLPQSGTEARTDESGPYLKRGARVELLIRPERLAFSSQSENRARGVIKEVLYQGAFTIWVLEAEWSSQPILVSRPNTVRLAGEAALVPGASVEFGWSAEDCILAPVGSAPGHAL